MHYLIFLFISLFSLPSFAERTHQMALAEWQSIKKCITTEQEYKLRKQNFASCSLTFIKPNDVTGNGAQYYPGIIAINIINTTGKDVTLETPASLQTPSSKIAANGSFAATGNCISSDNAGVDPVSGIPLKLRPYSGQFCLYDQANGTTCQASTDYDNKISFTVPKNATANNPCKIRLRFTPPMFSGNEDAPINFMRDLILAPTSCANTNCATHVTFFNLFAGFRPIFVTRNKYKVQCPSDHGVTSFCGINEAQMICYNELASTGQNIDEGLTEPWMADPTSNPSLTDAVTTFGGDLMTDEYNNLLNQNINYLTLNQIFDQTNFNPGQNVGYLGPRITDVEYNYYSLFDFTPGGSVTSYNCSGTIAPGGNKVPSVTVNNSYIISIWSAVSPNGTYTNAPHCGYWQQNSGFITGGIGQIFYYKAAFSNTSPTVVFSPSSTLFCTDVASGNYTNSWTTGLIANSALCTSSQRILCIGN